MADYLRSIIQPLLSHPDALKISESNDNLGVLLAVDLNVADMGNIVGRGGEGAKAVRHLMRIYGYRVQARISVKFNEPIGGKFAHA